MKDEEPSRILSVDADIVPSSGFVASVMDAVRREATAPPIPFPWKRALPGLCACGIALLSVLIIAIAAFSGENSGRAPASMMQLRFAAILEGWKAVGATWIVLGLISAFVSVKLSMLMGTHKVMNN